MNSFHSATPVMAFPKVLVALLLPLLGVGGSVAAPAPAAGASRPNIVFILADDLGYGDLGCYGQTVLQTPHIDQLAAEGLRFTQNYAGAPVCEPSRSSLLTGLHGGHVRHRALERFVNDARFRPGDVTFADVMKAAGYATAIAGKWHLGDQADNDGMPHHHGFDFALGPGSPYPAGGIEHWPSHVFVNGVRTAIPENAGGRHGRYMDDIYTDAALTFIREHRSGPFLVYLAFQSPHAPIDGAEHPPYASRDWPAVERRFASMVDAADRNVGRVLAALRELGLERNTVVFFSSGNGPHHEGGHSAEFFHSHGLLHGVKRDLHEGGIRVPLLVRWPGVVAAGTSTDFVSAFCDMLPTFAELGGGPRAEARRRHQSRADPAWPDASAPSVAVLGGAGRTWVQARRRWPLRAGGALGNVEGRAHRRAA